MDSVIAEYLSAGGDVGTLGLFLYLLREQIATKMRLLRLEIRAGIDRAARQ